MEKEKKVRLEGEEEAATPMSQRLLLGHLILFLSLKGQLKGQ